MNARFRNLNLAKSLQELEEANRGEPESGSHLVAEWTGNVVLKLVNTVAEAQALRVKLSGAKKLPHKQRNRVNRGTHCGERLWKPALVMPQTSSITVSERFNYEAPPHSVTAFRIAAR